jgi:hypothetical protein
LAIAFSNSGTHNSLPVEERPNAGTKHERAGSVAVVVVGTVVVVGIVVVDGAVVVVGTVVVDGTVVVAKEVLKHGKRSSIVITFQSPLTCIDMSYLPFWLIGSCC